MTNEPTSEGLKATPPAGGGGWLPAVSLAARVSLLFVAAFASVAAFVFLVPEGNDYGRANVLKYERLVSLPAPKIVLIGGSNLAYGVDSAQLEEATGCPVVNMGMNGYFGVRYMLNESRPHLNRGDIAIVAFEWDNFFKTVDGSPAHFVALIKSNPHAFSALSLDQQVATVGQFPRVAQYKVTRLIGDGIESARVRVIGERTFSRPPELQNIEVFSAFTPEGDIVSHLGVDWPYELEDGIAPPGREIEQPALDLMQAFAAEMDGRGVRVLNSYTPVLRRFYDENASRLDEVHRRTLAMSPMVAPRGPGAYAMDQEYFFDTIYHLDAEGRAIRTQMLVEDLQAAFGQGAVCRATETASQ